MNATATVAQCLDSRNVSLPSADPPHSWVFGGEGTCPILRGLFGPQTAEHLLVEGLEGCRSGFLLHFEAKRPRTGAGLGLVTPWWRQLKGFGKRRSLHKFKRYILLPG